MRSTIVALAVLAAMACARHAQVASSAETGAQTSTATNAEPLPAATSLAADCGRTLQARTIPPPPRW